MGRACNRVIGPSRTLGRLLRLTQEAPPPSPPSSLSALPVHPGKPFSRARSFANSTLIVVTSWGHARPKRPALPRSAEPSETSGQDVSPGPSLLPPRPAPEPPPRPIPRQGGRPHTSPVQPPRLRTERSRTEPEGAPVLAQYFARRGRRARDRHRDWDWTWGGQVLADDHVRCVQFFRASWGLCPLGRWSWAVG